MEGPFFDVSRLNLQSQNDLCLDIVAYCFSGKLASIPFESQEDLSRPMNRAIFGRRELKMKIPFTALAIVASLTACASVESSKSKLSSWVGAPESELLNRYGRLSHDVKSINGERSIVFNRIYLDRNGFYRKAISCNVIFYTRNGLISNVALEGTTAWCLNDSTKFIR